MWSQRLHRVTHGLVAVVVITGSLALLSCGSDHQDTAQTTRGVLLDSTTDRANVTATNLPILANRNIAIDAAAFAFGTVAPSSAPDPVILQISNVIACTPGTAGCFLAVGTPLTVPTCTPGAAGCPFFPTLVAPLATAASAFFNTNGVLTVANSCPGAIAVLPDPALPATAAVAAAATQPVAAATYRVMEANGITVRFSGVLCIGAGTVTTPGQGGNICAFTNDQTSPLLPTTLAPPSTGPTTANTNVQQSIFTSCRIAVGTLTGTGGNIAVPVGGGTVAGTVQLTVTNQRSNIAYVSLLPPANTDTGFDISIATNGSVFANGIDTTIDVPIP